MCPPQSFFATPNPALRAAHARHKSDPTTLEYPPAGATLVQYTAPLAEAREQWLRLNRAGVFCLSVEKTSAGTRVVYAMPAGLKLS